MKKLTFLFVTLVASTFTLVSCGSDDDGGKKKVEYPDNAFTVDGTEYATGSAEMYYYGSYYANSEQTEITDYFAFVSYDNPDTKLPSAYIEFFNPAYLLAGDGSDYVLEGKYNYTDFNVNPGNTAYGVISYDTTELTSHDIENSEVTAENVNDIYLNIISFTTDENTSTTTVDVDYSFDFKSGDDVLGGYTGEVIIYDSSSSKSGARTATPTKGFKRIILTKEQVLANGKAPFFIKK